MARTHSIHMVTDMYQNVQAAFTVKHECFRYLTGLAPNHRRYLMVQKARDGEKINHHQSPFVPAERWLDEYRA